MAVWDNPIAQLLTLALSFPAETQDFVEFLSCSCLALFEFFSHKICEHNKVKIKFGLLCINSN
jgi:hypothetical protein